MTDKAAVDALIDRLYAASTIIAETHSASCIQRDLDRAREAVVEASAALRELQKEVEQLQANEQDQNALREDQNALRVRRLAERDAARAEVEALRADFERFAEHDGRCDAALRRDETRCDCGLNQARERWSKKT